MRGAVRATDTRSIAHLVHPGSGACEGQPNYLAKAMTVKQIVRLRTWAEKKHCDNDGARWSTARATASPCCRHGNLEERVVESVPVQVVFTHKHKKVGAWNTSAAMRLLQSERVLKKGMVCGERACGKVPCFVVRKIQCVRARKRTSRRVKR